MGLSTVRMGQALVITSLYLAFNLSKFSLAEAPPPVPSHWGTQAIASARDNFRHFPPTRLGLMQQELLDAYHSTEEWLEQESSEGVSPEEWKERLDWNNFTNWVTKTAQPPTSAAFQEAVARLKPTAAKLYQNKPGFDNEHIVRLRLAIAHLGKAAYYSSIPDLRQEYLTRLYQLDAAIYHWDQNHDENSRRNIGDLLQWIEDAELGGRLVAQIREHFAHPNVRLTTSAKFLMGQVKTDSKLSVDEEVESVFQGYRTKGVVTTRATVTPKLSSNPDRIDITLHLDGTAIAPDNVATEDPQEGEQESTKTKITVHSKSESKLGGTKIIGIDPSAKPYRQPTKAWATTHIEVQPEDIQVESDYPRVGRKLAFTRWEQKQKATEKQASEFAAERFRKLINGIKPIPLPFFTEVFPQFVRTPLDRVGMFPKSVRFSSTEDAAMVTMRVAASNRLGSDLPIPPIPAEHDVVFQIHESALNNIPLGVYAENGRFTDEATAATIKFLTGRIPPETMRVYTGVERWSFQTEADPLLVTCSDGNIAFDFKITQLTRAGRTIEGPFVVHGTYTPTVSYFGPKFVRKTMLLVDVPPGLTQDDMDFIGEKAEGFFRETLDLAGLLPPSGGSAEALSKLRLTQIYASGKFLAFGYDEEKTEESDAQP